jgi:hypothetical protein
MPLDEHKTTPRTVDDVLRDMRVIHSGRTRYVGQEPRDDELMVAEIERLRSIVDSFSATPFRCDDCHRKLSATEIMGV